ncbi:MAG TPA: response regulator [Cyanobacteria bacterium UBA8803]|nr:response regulator [Cyanobacteria bacterium UBA9273]HBL60286.1 response regulator [Cyanobacteria bacterium UBA8803]
MNSDTIIKPIEILLIEDSPSDADLTEEALSNARIINKLHWVEDGVEAMAFLHRQGKYGGANRPDLILLDLNLPKKNGLEVLAEIKADAQLKRIPTIVLTTSEAERDILKTYDLNGNCYVSKPINLERFMFVIKLIQLFWLDVVKLPSE